jgi:hypothetical protein
MSCRGIRTASPWAIPTAALALCVAASTAACGDGGGEYDVTPLLASIRPAQRAGVPGQVGVSSLAELPLYTIDVQLDLALLTFQGFEDVVIRNRTGRQLADVVFRLYPNARQLNVEGSQNLAVTDVQVDGESVASQLRGPTTLRVPLADPLDPGRSVTVRVAFRGALPRYRDADADPIQQGLAQIFDVIGSGEARGGDYGVFGAGAGIVNMGLWYPRLADWTTQGWDASDPAGIGDISTLDLANYRVSITTARDAAVVTTGALETQGDVDSPAGATRRTFVAAAVRSFAWQASRSYASQERRVGDVTVRSTFDRAHADRGARVADIAAAALTSYERLFGPYPYTELDVVEAPLRGGAGGMEWPGLVTAGRSLYQPPASLTGLLGTASPPTSPSQDYWLETLEFVVAHEISHQYWNAVVGSDSELHPYIDECLAQFSAAAYFRDRYGAEREQEVLNRQVRVNYHLHRMLGGADGAVDRPAQAFASTIEYTGLVYGKGPYYFVELRRELGEGAFAQGMQTYYQRFRFRTVSQTDLPNVLAEVSANRPTVDRLTRRWLAEAHGDEDLGQGTFSDVLEPVLGPEASGMLRALENLLGGATGGGQGPGQRRDRDQSLDDLIRGLGTGLGDLLQGLGAGTGSGSGSGTRQPQRQP